MLLRRLSIALAAAATLAAHTGTLAQEAAADSGGGTSLFDAEDVRWAAGFAAVTVVMAPLDRALARELQDSALQASRFLKYSSTGVRVLGSPGALVLGSGVYLGGRVGGNRDIAQLGLHTTEAVLIADGITGVIKMVAGRDRPSLEPDHPFSFHLFGGFRGDPHRSFPSGHTTSAFAAAAAATESVRILWPKQRAWVGVVLYGAAGLTGISRVYNNAHWASDVVVGAAIGSFTGWKVVRYSNSHPGNTIDRIFLGRRRDSDNARAARLLPFEGGGGIPITITIHTG